MEYRNLFICRRDASRLSHDSSFSCQTDSNKFCHGSYRSGQSFLFSEEVSLRHFGESQNKGDKEERIRKVEERVRVLKVQLSLGNVRTQVW